MQNPEIDALRKEIERLNDELVRTQKSLADVWKYFGLESNNTTEHFGKLHEHVRHVWDYLIPVIDKVFPNLRTEQKEAAKFLDSLQATFKTSDRPPPQKE